MADHFLALTPDEIFELAERASRDDAEPAGGGAPVAAIADVSSWRSLVERVTEVLTRQLELPTYDEWMELYRKDPAGVESRLLGLWRERS